MDRSLLLSDHRIPSSLFPLRPHSLQNRRLLLKKSHLSRNAIFEETFHNACKNDGGQIL